MNWRFSTPKEELAHNNVAKGLAWLQESGPLHGLDWRLIGTFSPIHTATGHTCPLAQASGPNGRYWTTLNKLRQDGVIAHRDLMLDWAYEHGFTCGSNATDTDQHIPWRFLDDAWDVALHEARRLAAWSFVDRSDLRLEMFEEERWLHALVAAEKGLAWLQEHGAEHNLDWLRINVGTVRVASDVDCPLGQASSYPMLGGKGSYMVTTGRLIKADVVTWRDKDLWAYEHGFHDWGNAGQYIPYYVLTKAWKQVLTEAHRRREATA